MNNQSNSNFFKLIKIVKKLRSPNGCLWDQKQTHDSLIPFFLEEVYEVIESIDNRNWESLEEELGDVLLHIVFQAQIAEESSFFNISTSIDKLNQKLILRHPNVFGKNKNKKLNWEENKHIEKKRKSRLDGVPKNLPALIRSQRLQQKASEAGFDWDNIDPVIEKIYEELKELKDAIKLKNTKYIEEELGDVFFSMVNLSRHLDLSAENLLRKSNKKFSLRFKKLEKKVISNGKKLQDLSLSEMDKIWDEIKRK